jgi:CubicO group peptidase (beta-lactamase class C family)
MFGYHGLTIGPLMSELCFRITGLTLQNYFEKEVRSLANGDAYLGLPEALESRVTQLDMSRIPVSAEVLAKYTRPDGYHSSGIAEWSRGAVDMKLMVEREGRAFGLASAEGVASARGLADVMQWATGFGGHTPGVSPMVLEDMSQTQVYGYDMALEIEHRSFGTVFQKSTSGLFFGSYQAFGHDGAAGALLYADPKGEIVLGYTVSRFTVPGGADAAIQPIIDLVRSIANS